MRVTSLLHKSKDPRTMPALKALEMATFNGARAMGINAGMLKTGCLADIIIIDLEKPKFISCDLISSLVNGASGCDVKTTIVNGKVLMEDHKIIGFDEVKIMEDARKARSGIIC